MKIYSRYILFRALKWFVFMQFLSISIVLFFPIIQSVASGLPLSVTLAILPHFLPQEIANSAPIATVTAICFTFLPMAQQGEITAFKVIGVPLWRILIPIYLALIGLSIVNVKINDISNSTAREKRNQTILNQFEKIVLSQLKKEKSYSEPNSTFTLDVADVTEDGTLIHPSFQIKKKDVNGVAERASLNVVFRGETPFIVVDFFNSEATERNNEFIFPKEFHQEIPLEEIYNKKSRVDPKASEVTYAIKNLEAESDAYHRQMAAKASFALLCGNVDEASKQEWHDLRGREKGFQKRYNQYKIVEPRNWAYGFSYFFVAWASIPLAIFYPRIIIRVRNFKYELPSSPVIIFAVIIIFWGSWGIFYTGAKKGDFPSYFVWIGDVILGIMGAFYLRKIH